jgi:hypothetical protein
MMNYFIIGSIIIIIIIIYIYYINNSTTCLYKCDKICNDCYDMCNYDPECIKTCYFNKGECYKKCIVLRASKNINKCGCN